MKRGLVLTLTIMLETGETSRFDEVGDYASYCRCISGTKLSNGKINGNSNNKNGNKFLSWVFTETVNLQSDRTVSAIMECSSILKELIETGECGIVGGSHDISTGQVHFYQDTMRGFFKASDA